MANEKKFMLPFQEEEEKRKSKLIEPVQYTEIPYRDPLENLYKGNYDNIRKASNIMKALAEKPKTTDEEKKIFNESEKVIFDSKKKLARDVFNDEKIKNLLKDKKFEEAFSEADKYMTPFALADADKEGTHLLARDVYQRLLSKLMRNEKILSPMTKDINKNREEINRTMDKLDPGLLEAYRKLGKDIEHQQYRQSFNTQDDIDERFKEEGILGGWVADDRKNKYGMVLPSKYELNNDNYDQIFLHEKTHAIDKLADVIANMDKNDPKRKIWDEYVALQKSEAKRKRLNEILEIAESKKKNLIESEGDVNSNSIVGRSPSFQDFDWSKGQFKDKFTTPTDMYKEIGSMHHYLGPETIEHIKNYIEEGVPGITENEPRFKKLSSLLKRV